MSVGLRKIMESKGIGEPQGSKVECPIQDVEDSSGSARDERYLERIVTCAKRQIAAFSAEARGGGGENDVKAFAQTWLPEIEADLRVIRHIIAPGID